MHRGVFATFTGPISRAATIWAALLSCGNDAVLSHFTAAELLGLTDEARLVVHVSIPSSRRLALRDGVAVHLSRHLPAARHPTKIPAQTRVEHTVFDLIEQAGSHDEAFAWLSAACGRRLTTASRLAGVLADRPKMKWRRELTEALDDVASGCHSMLERRYLRDVERAHGLPGGVRQNPIGRFGGQIYHDIYYLSFRTVVELDGRAAHPAESRFRDLHRDNVAAIRDDIVLHYGWHDVVSQPCLVAAQVAGVLTLHGWTGRLRKCGPCCMIAKG